MGASYMANTVPRGGVIERIKKRLWNRDVKEDVHFYARKRISFALRVVAGLHVGALLRLSSAACLGRAQDNDIVLHDPGIWEHHAKLQYIDGLWRLIDLGGNHVIRPIEMARRGRFLRSRYGLGAAEVILTQVVNLPLANRWFLPTPSGILILTSSALIFGFIVYFWSMYPVGDGERISSFSLAEAGFSDVSVVTLPRRKHEVIGYVSDHNEFKNLNLWLRQNFRANQFSLQVRIGSEIVARVREALDDPAFSVEYISPGVVGIHGKINSVELYERLNLIIGDLNGVVRIENDVLFFKKNIAESVKEHILPIRVVSVSPGENGSFSGDDGVRYFVGGILPDGAEVISIRSDVIEFKIGDHFLRHYLPGR